MIYNYIYGGVKQYRNLTRLINYSVANIKESGRDFHFNKQQPAINKKDLKKFEKRDANLIKENYKNGFTNEEVAPYNDMVKKALKLDNATPSEILAFKINKAIQKYQLSPNDTASASVQIAVLTERIIHQIKHCQDLRKDVKAARRLNQLLDQRRIMANYLRRTDYHRYKLVIRDYGIPEIPPLNHHANENFRLFRNKTTNSFSGRK